MTLVKDSLHSVPLGRLARGARVLLVTVAHRADLGAGVTFANELRQTFSNVRAEYLDADNPGAGDGPWRLLQIADSADVTIVGSYVGQSWDAASLDAPVAISTFIQALAQRGARPILVAFGNPYLLQQVPGVSAYLVAWGGFPMSQRAAARALVGATALTGTLPISIPPYATFGAGIQLAPLHAPTS